ncbi:hypothetical protein T11_11666 [Trichinella zimbabwensis]|uniref:Uncharacterized protein n=1 Tax=Trichinella zimbabwensis TaxID=268475 RepID=A0A0V1I052_9BILA|nr:hypothetical protein T11_11666 [Trichinella zimbabwensis]
MSCCCLEGFGNLFSDLPILVSAPVIWCLEDLYVRGVMEVTYSMICVIILLNLFCQNENQIKSCIPTPFALFLRFGYVNAVIDNNDDADQEQ